MTQHDQNNNGGNTSTKNTRSKLRFAYAHRSVKDLSSSTKFLSQRLGFPVTSQDAEHTVFGSENQLHALSISGNGSEAIGIEVESADALEQIQANLKSANYQTKPMGKELCALRQVKQGLSALDASGNIIEFIIRPFCTANFPLPSRTKGITGLSGAALRSTDIDGDTRFWLTCADVKVADWVGDITYLKFDDQHHRIALYPSTQNGVLYTRHQIDSFDSLMKQYHALRKIQVEFGQGVGRETVSKEYFLRVQSTENQLYSIGFGMNTVSAEALQARQFELSPTSLCCVGSENHLVPELSGGSHDSSVVKQLKGVS